MKKLLFLAVLLLGFAACEDKENSYINNSTPYLMEVTPASEFTLLNKTGGVVSIEISEESYVQSIYEKGENIDFSGVRILGSDEENYSTIYSYGGPYSASEKKGDLPWVYDLRDWYVVRQTGLRTFEIECFPCEDDRSLKLFLMHLTKNGPHAIVKVSLVAEESSDN